MNADAAIISGSDLNASQNNDSSSQQSSSSDDDDSNARTRKYEIPSEDVLYDPNLDEEDEAWVCKHKRGGNGNFFEQQMLSMARCDSGNNDATLSSIPIAERNKLQHHENDDSGNIPETEALQHEQKQPSSLQSRKSDAILSCPCCFEILCMDCQRHERYANQFRAMFVMNIGVSWDVTICPEHLGGKVTDKDKRNSLDTSHIKKAKNSSLVHGNNHWHGSSNVANVASNNAHIVDGSQAAANGIAKSSGSEEIYFSVYCNKCCTVVAGLNMQDEVYHFFGCLASG